MRFNISCKMKMFNQRCRIAITGTFLFTIPRLRINNLFYVAISHVLLKWYVILLHTGDTRVVPAINKENPCTV